MVVNDTKIFQKINSKKKLVEYRRNIIKCDKMSYYNDKKLFKFQKICFFSWDKAR